MDDCLALAEKPVPRTICGTEPWHKGSTSGPLDPDRKKERHDEQPHDEKPQGDPLPCHSSSSSTGGALVRAAHERVLATSGTGTVGACLNAWRKAFAADRRVRMSVDPADKLAAVAVAEVQRNHMSGKLKRPSVRPRPDAARLVERRR